MPRSVPPDFSFPPSAAFVAATRPQWAVFAAGHRNRWNFPAASVVERWQEAGAQSIVTGRSGAVSFLLGTDVPLAPEQWRLEDRRPWRDP